MTSCLDGKQMPLPWKQDFSEYMLSPNFRYPGNLLTKPDSNLCEAYPELDRAGESGLHTGVLEETRLLKWVLGGLVPDLNLPWDCWSFSQKLFKCFKQPSSSGVGKQTLNPSPLTTQGQDPAASHLHSYLPQIN